MHPAWWVGTGMVIARQVVADAIAYSDRGIAFAREVLAGMPGGERPLRAFFVPM